MLDRLRNEVVEISQVARLNRSEQTVVCYESQPKVINMQIVSLEENEESKYAFELQRRLLECTADYERQLNQARAEQYSLAASCASL